MSANRSRRGIRRPRLPNPSAAETALWLLEQGFWPIPISPVNDPRSPSPGKAPIGRAWGTVRPSPRRLGELYRRHPAAGVGVLLGPSGGVIDLEVDDPACAGPLLDRLFRRGVPETLGWRSARGDHRLFAWDERLGGLGLPAVVSLGDGALELRLGGRDRQVVTVCPPSPGADGRARTWNGVWEVAPLPAALLRELTEGRRPNRRRARRGGAPGEGPAPSDRYGATALEREAALVRTAEPGTRNRTLNRAAFNLGQIVAAGLLSRGAVEAELAGAALDCGLPGWEVRSTLKSGLDAGERRPRGIGAPG